MDEHALDLHWLRVWSCCPSCLVLISWSKPFYVPLQLPLHAPRCPYVLSMHSYTRVCALNMPYEPLYDFLYMPLCATLHAAMYPTHLSTCPMHLSTWLHMPVHGPVPHTPLHAPTHFLTWLHMPHT